MMMNPVSLILLGKFSLSNFFQKSLEKIILQNHLLEGDSISILFQD